MALNSLKKYAHRLIKEPKVNLEKHTIEFFGQKIYSPTNIFQFFGKPFLINSEEEFYKKTKPIFLKYLEYRVKDLSLTMNVPISYKVRVQNMKTRLGSNSRATNTLNFAMKLVHYSKEAIDAIVIHELAHYFHFDHSNSFYKVVYKYCPNYDKLNREFKD